MISRGTGNQESVTEVAADRDKGGCKLLAKAGRHMHKVSKNNTRGEI